MLGVRGCIGKNPSPTSARDSVKTEDISEGQPSSYELTFGVELGLNPHSKNIDASILQKSIIKVQWKVDAIKCLSH